MFAGRSASGCSKGEVLVGRVATSGGDVHAEKLTKLVKAGGEQGCDEDVRGSLMSAR